MSQSVNAYASTRLAEDKRGNPRIWIEGRKLENSGFVPSQRYKMTVDDIKGRIILEIDPDGDRTVSRRSRHGHERPIVDIANAKALASFPKNGTLRIDFGARKVVIQASAIERRIANREKQTKERILKQEPLRAGSISTGLGVLSHALHTGLCKTGIDSQLAFSVEIDEEYQERCALSNPVWSSDTQAITMPLQEFAFDKDAIAGIEQVDILEAGIPCTAHSLAGRSKKHLAMPEHDPVAGHLVVGFLAIVAACNPSIVIVENVPQYAESASFAILQNQLNEWGYNVNYQILKGEEFGCLEHRNRMVMIATSQGMDPIMKIDAEGAGSVIIGDILDEVEDDSSLWSKMSYLKDKEKRDKAEGKGFRMQILGPEDSKVGTIGRGYAKVRSTEPKLRHPTNPDLLRQFTPAEHARIKGIPEIMVSGLPVTQAHEMLGQSIVTQPFKAVGKTIGLELLRWAHGRPRAVKSAKLSPISPPSTQKNDNDKNTDQLKLFG